VRLAIGGRDVAIPEAQPTDASPLAMLFLHRYRPMDKPENK